AALDPAMPKHELLPASSSVSGGVRSVCLVERGRMSPMSRPTAISPEEQEQIARQIGILLLQNAPEDWQEITVEYRATGEYRDLLGEITSQDGASRAWDPPNELQSIFERLREGMYRPDVGTWLSALYVVERPSSYRIDINFDSEPRWQRPLPPAAYLDELQRYPRTEENIPDWMRAIIDGATQDRKSTRLNSSHVKISYDVFCLKK